MSSRWPFFDLRIRTPRLELRPDWDDGLEQLATVAAEGIHEPEFMPFKHPWSLVGPEERALSVVQWNWRSRGELTPENWSLNLLAVVDGRVVGMQGLNGVHFGRLRAVESGSWLGLAHQGKGIGTEMRAAALHLAFTGLGALIARSGAFDDNRRSLGVSRALGYEDDGDAEYLRGDPGMAGRILRLKLTLERWEQHRPDLDVTVEHLEPCLPLLGVTP